MLYPVLEILDKMLIRRCFRLLHDINHDNERINSPNKKKFFVYLKGTSAARRARHQTDCTCRERIIYGGTSFLNSNLNTYFIFISFIALSLYYYTNCRLLSCRIISTRYVEIIRQQSPRVIGAKHILRQKLFTYRFIIIYKYVLYSYE